MNKHFKGLRTHGLFVTDLEEATRWYTNVLGQDPYFKEDFYVGFNVSGYELGLQPTEEKAPSSAASPSTYWGVDDVETEYKRLLGLGASEYEEPHNVGGELVVAAVRDPWNNVFGLIYNPYFKAEIEPVKHTDNPEVTALGGVFFKSADPDRLKKWYKENLGVNAGEYGGTFEWQKPDGTPGFTAWSPFKHDTKYFDPGKQQYMINYRVKHLDKLLERLKKAGVEVVGEVETYEYGKFGWILDIDGNKVELWEPDDAVYAKMAGEKNVSS